MIWHEQECSSVCTRRYCMYQMIVCRCSETAGCAAGNTLPMQEADAHLRQQCIVIMVNKISTSPGVLVFSKILASERTDYVSTSDSSLHAQKYQPGQNELPWLGQVILSVACKQYAPAHVSIPGTRMIITNCKANVVFHCSRINRTVHCEHIMFRMSSCALFAGKYLSHMNTQSSGELAVSKSLHSAAAQHQGLPGHLAAR